MGKRNPVELVSAVVKRKIAVVTGNLFEANIPPTTISPLPIATRVIMTCKIVKAPSDIPKIMESPRCWRARSQRFDFKRGSPRRDPCLGYALGSTTTIAAAITIASTRIVSHFIVGPFHDFPSETSTADTELVKIVGVGNRVARAVCFG